jgi:hypothetical protein
MTDLKNVVDIDSVDNVIADLRKAADRCKKSSIWTGGYIGENELEDYADRLTALQSTGNGCPDYLFIPASNGLDPIYVYFTDFELGKGMMTVSCFGQAWSCGFNAMGKRGIKEFIKASGADYVANKMESVDIRKKSYRDYTMKIAKQVIAALPPKDD